VIIRDEPVRDRSSAAYDLKNLAAPEAVAP
jgi:hypothetical protein